PMLRLLLSLPTFFLLFLFHCFRAHRPLHSFPTRRSSDLSAFSPAKKYSVDQLKKDYSIYRNVLEEAHPGLYWYTSKDSMDYYFKDRKSTRLNSSHVKISYAVFCLKKKRRKKVRDHSHLID